MTLENNTSRHNGHGSKASARVKAAAFLVAGVIAMSGCSLLPNGNKDGAPVGSPASSTPAPGAAVAETETPKTAAQELSAKVSDSLQGLTTTSKAPNREQMTAALVAAGADPATVEVSVDITPTGPAVDAIEAAALVDAECVVGQVRDGAVAVTILPVLESGRCFVGNVH